MTQPATGVCNRLLDTSLAVNDESFPTYIQNLHLMGHYVEAFHNVLAHLDELFAT